MSENRDRMSKAMGSPVMSRFSDSHWRSLQFFNAYRIAVAMLMLMSVAILDADTFLGWRDRKVFLYACFFYVAFGLLCFLPARIRRPELDWQLTAQVFADALQQWDAL